MNNKNGFVWTLALFVGTSGCSLIVDTETNNAGGNPGGTLQYGQICTSDSECVSGICDSQVSFSASRCTETCDSTGTSNACSANIPAQCGSDNRCKFNSPPPLTEDPNIGYIYVGSVGAHGWTKTHDDSRLDLEQEFPEAMTDFVPLVDPAEAEAQIQEIGRAHV